MIACVILIILCGAALAAAAAYAQELRRMARFLSANRPESNERLDAACPLPGCVPLVRAVDARLEADRARVRERAADERRFQEELAALSHDIRTPLAGAKGYLQLAADEGDAAEREACLNAAAERLDAMQVLLDQLFAYARSQDAESVGALEEVDAVLLLESVLAGAHPLFEERGMAVEMTLDRPFPVMADAEALRRVLENVVRNAAEHGAGALSVRREESALVFANGLPTGAEVDASRVFERFYQADAARRRGNAGLGLSTVQNLCAALGMQATVHVDAGTFTLRLICRP